MTDFQAYQAGVHIVNGTNDYNNILDHAFEKEYAFLVRKNGSDFEAIKGSGASDSGKITYGGAGNAGGIDGANATAVINAALAGLTPARTSMEKVFLKGTFTIDAPIVLSEFTHLELEGTISLANGSNCNMIQNAHPTAHDSPCIIEGGKWFGNGANQTSGNIIYWEEQTDTHHDYYWNPLEIRNVKAYYPYTDSVRLYAHGGGCYSQCVIDGGMFTSGAANPSYGINETNFNDAYILNVLPVGAIRMDTFGNFVLHNCYINTSWTGCLNVETGIRLFMSNCFLDTNGQIAALLGGLVYSTFSNLQVRVQGTDIDVEAAIKLYDWEGNHCHDNTFSNIIMGRFEYSGTREFTYGIEEADANQDYNVYSNINGRDCVTAALRMLGANSKPTLNNEHTIIGSVIRV